MVVLTFILGVGCFSLRGRAPLGDGWSEGKSSPL